jgi:hypothetical protein
MVSYIEGKHKLKIPENEGFRKIFGPEKNEHILGETS